MAVTFTYYDHFLEILGDGTLDMDNDTFKLALLDNTHVFVATNTVFADVSGDEIAAGFGYTAGGETLTAVTYVQTAAIVKFDANDVLWTASGGPLATSRFALLYDTTADALLGLIDMDGDKTPGDGDSLTVQWDPTNGVFTIA